MIHIKKKARLSDSGNDEVFTQSQPSTAENKAVVAQKNNPIKQIETDDDDDDKVFQPTLSNTENSNGLFFPEFGNDSLLIAICRLPSWVNNKKIQYFVDTLPIINLTNKNRGWFLTLLGRLPSQRQVELTSIVNTVIEKGTKLDARTYIKLLSLAKYFDDPEKANVAFARKTEKMTDLPAEIAKANGLNFEEIFQKLRKL